ncbi:MAG: ABC transporter substrate-binding protein [Candidatus Bathyarchaeota archaeon]|nr:ABC transporter substrate-binding protein [Candidatus Termiticorpusculum sp.]MCL1971286.1 ABC transporter substrate-binding protein [Candidatus Termiticorpusculum sp.]
MTNKATIIAIILIAIIASASTYAIYNEFYKTSNNTNPDTTPTTTTTPPTETTMKPTAAPTTPTPPPTPTPEPQPKNITVTDGSGRTFNMTVPIKRVVVLDVGISDILYVMGVQNLIIGRSDTVISPQSILNVPSVGQNAYYLNAEKVLELNPDFILTDNLILYNEAAYQQLTNSGIPIYVTGTISVAIDPSTMTPEELYAASTVIDHACDLMQELTPIFGHEQEVNTYITWAQSYNKIVKDRVAALAPKDQTIVFLDWYSYPYRTWANLGVYQAGGVNIAENEVKFDPLLSPEFVAAKNPSVIITMISSEKHDIKDFTNARNDILSRPALQGVDAVKNGRVYVCDFSARSGVRAIIGYLYWATWLQPDLFADINPVAVEQYLNQQFFKTEAIGTYCYGI